MKVNQSQHTKVLHEPKSPSFGGVRGGSGPKGSRGDPPERGSVRGDPPWILVSRGDPPLLKWKWNHPPDVENMQKYLFVTELTFRVICCQRRQHGRGMSKKASPDPSKRGEKGKVV